MLLGRAEVQVAYLGRPAYPGYAKVLVQTIAVGASCIPIMANSFMDPCLGWLNADSCFFSSPAARLVVLLAAKVRGRNRAIACCGAERAMCTYIKPLLPEPISSVGAWRKHSNIETTSSTT